MSTGYLLFYTGAGLLGAALILGIVGGILLTKMHKKVARQIEDIYR